MHTQYVVRRSRKYKSTKVGGCAIDYKCAYAGRRDETWGLLLLEACYRVTSLPQSVVVLPLTFLFFSLTFLLSSFWTSRGHRCRPFPVSSPLFLPSIFIVHRVQQSHCSSIFHQVMLTHALALSASQFVQKKKSTNLYEYALGGIRTYETDLYQARG